MNAPTRRGAIRILEKSCELLEPRGAWTQGTLYRDRRGAICSPSVAVSYCINGARYAAGDRLRAHAAHRRAADDAVKQAVGMHAWMFNDSLGRTKRQGLAVIRKAIRNLEGGAA